MDVVGEVIPQGLLRLIASVAGSSKASSPSPLDLSERFSNDYMVETPNISWKKLAEMTNDDLNFGEPVEDTIDHETHYLTLIEISKVVRVLQLLLRIGRELQVRRCDPSTNVQKQA